MNVVGRKLQKSGSTGHTHQRQHSSDGYVDSSFNNKWLQSAGLHHIQPSNPSIPPLQDIGLYGNNGAGPYSRYARNYQGNDYGGENDFFADPSIPPFSSRSNMRKNGEDDGGPHGDFSPGLLDLQSFDTELLTDIPKQYNESLHYQSVHRANFEDFDPYFPVDKISNETNVVNNFSNDKEKPTNVAKIKVVVRKRPLNRKENSRKEEDIVTIQSNSNRLAVHESKLKVDLTEYVEKHEFVFDAVLSEDVSNEEVYAETVQPIVPIIFQRTKATCFAYGQTGSGKTYTMKPLPLKASQDIFRLMHHEYRNQGFQLFVSFFEIYGGKLFDLLNDRKKLCMREDGKQQVCIVGLQEFRVSDVEVIKELIERGNSTRSTGTTGANEESSRSHAILQLAIKKLVDGNDAKKPPRNIGKLSFIDLAGSERGADTTDNDKQTRMEGAEINKSLLALKECIRALDNDQGHIPFRGSKLTEVLRDSFVGNSRTVMISCISPNAGSCEHTLNTLRYADRVKSLSKGNNSKKDQLSSSLNVRSSVTFPLSSSAAASLPVFDDNLTAAPYESTRFGWSKQIEKEPSPSLNIIERVPSGRAHSNNSSYANSYKDRRSDQVETTEDEFYYSEAMYENVIPPFMTGKSELLKVDDDLDALLKEEEELVSAHRKHIEETMDIVKEEMNLLVEVEQPGNQLDDYVSQLDEILSQKAAVILQLQTRLSQFQRRLKEYNVLMSSSGQ
ncbi:kinesin-like protein KIN-13B [Impatiens glandulifera]|uniref:kinesin-like protein KIN-13B n=1 Tax=Impatiens glandulifera TaxID=253017 RepID=UPI001FB0DAFF|nr:kinesin-like protein KIN-13B [Impatiens glandulifera]